MINVHPVHETVPSPLPVDKGAEDSPIDPTVTPEAVIVPLYVACKPLAELEPAKPIIVSDIVTIPEFVAQTPFAPFA